MCRLLAIVGKIDEKLKSKTLENFQRLAQYGYIAPKIEKGHKDGWGIVAYKGGKISMEEKDLKSAYGNMKYSKAVSALEKTEQDIIIAHLRKATVGKRSIKNVHPFIFGNLTFCQNGTIKESEKIPLESKYAKLVKGETDSEKFFFFILQNLEKYKNRRADFVQKNIKNSLEFIKSNFDYTAINLIFSDGKNLWASREVNTKNEIVRRHKLLKYYSLFIGVDKHRKFSMISSEKIKIKDVSWRLLKNHEFLRVA